MIHLAKRQMHLAKGRPKMLNTHRTLTALTITILFTLVSTSIYLALAPIVLADERLSELRVIFYNGRFAEVLTKLYEYREQPYGKKAEVDYMIASCLCRTGSRDKAKKRFDWIISRYRLEPPERRIIEESVRQCSADDRTRARPFRESTVTSRAGERRVGVSGKGGTITDANSITRVAGSVVPVTSETAEVIRDINPEEFERRLFGLSQRAEAIQSVKELAGPNYKVRAAGPFILANKNLSSSEQVLTIARALERYASFYSTQYGMPQPYKFITIYLVADDLEMQRLASRLHGIYVSDSSIGYSFPFDMSMVGIIHNAQFGTLAHELFHLMVRNDFGDIPPWLEEGMASLYEVAQERGSYVAGVSNWRGRILAEFWRQRPSVEQLVKMDWRSFDGTAETRSFRRQAINHATARYLMLYLQEKGRLVDVYRAFRQQNIDDLEDDPSQEAVRLLASVLRKPLADVDQDFADWFLNLRGNETRMMPPDPDLPPTILNAPNTSETVNTPVISVPPSGKAPTGNATDGNAPTGNVVSPNQSQRRPPDPGPPPGPPPTPPKKKP
jgi:hypothetical protein